MNKDTRGKIDFRLKENLPTFLPVLLYLWELLFMGEVRAKLGCGVLVWIIFI